MKASVDSVETFGLVDGPGIRTVIFLNGCNLRCKFCHNPETWFMKEKDVTVEDIVDRVIRSKPYFKDNGGVTFSGGEPLLQIEFLEEVCTKLKDNGIHIAVDTSGVGLGNYNNLLSKIDLILLDIKAVDKEGFIAITQRDLFDSFMEFIEQLNQSGKEVWIRQVIIPGVNDNIEYIRRLSDFIKKHISNVSRVDFLPYHKMGLEKYAKLAIVNPYEKLDAMDKNKCDFLYNEFKKDFNIN